MQELKAKYKIISNEGSMPNQIMGQISDGRFFFFYARHGSAELSFGETPDEAISETAVWTGENDDYGWMSIAEFEDLFWKAVSEIEK